MNAPPKICVHCGEDCSNRPRVRNREGRYACRACVEQARDRANDAAAINELLGPSSPRADRPPSRARPTPLLLAAAAGVLILGAITAVVLLF